MKICAVIAEFDPFHLGHACLFRKAREAGADRIICLMSGNYVQRGAPAIADRQVRTEMALKGGADLVLAYPARFSCSSAESFASHAVAILDRLHIADFLAFGSEEGDLGRLTDCTEALLEESPAFRASLKAGLKRGLSYPAARAGALPEFETLLAEPNNILAVEYIKAILKTGSALEPVTFRREGAGFRDLGTGGVFASASGIRAVLAEGGEDAERQIRRAAGDEVCELLMRERGRHIGPDHFSLLLADRLFRAEDPRDLTRYLEVSPELAAGIFGKRNLLTTLTEMAGLCAARSVPRSRVMRALLHIALGLEENPAAEEGLYAHVLGFRRESADLCGRLRSQAEIPVIMNAPRYREYPDPAFRQLFEEEIRLSNLYHYVRASADGSPFRHELTKPLVIV